MRRPFLHLVVAAVAALLYARTTQFDFVRADDADLIGGNQPFLADLRHIPAAFSRSYFEQEGSPPADKTYYRPVAIVSFMIDAARGGARPGPYHATNVVLHAVAASLLLALATAWGAAPAAAFAAALLFAVHPVNAQSVAWIAGRNDLLVAIFGILSLLLFPSGPAGPSRRRAVHTWRDALGGMLHVVCIALALFSKETAVVLPLLALLQERALRRRLTRTGWIALGCDVAVVVIWAVARTRALEGAASEISPAALRAAIVNAPQMLVHAGKAVAPLRLNVSPGVDVAGIATGLAAIALLAWFAQRLGRPRLVWLGACWALAFLLPTLAVPGMPAYEHRLYVPLIGLLAGFAAAVGASRHLESTVAQGCIAVLAVAFTATTYARQDVFREPFAYWTDGTRDPQFGPVAHVNLGQLHEAGGRPNDARREYLRALERNPNTPKAHNNLGVVLMQLGEPDLALQHFIEETRRHPWNADAWFNVGLWYQKHGKEDEARAYFERARTITGGGVRAP